MSFIGGLSFIQRLNNTLEWDIMSVLHRGAVLYSEVKVDAEWGDMSL